MGVEAATYPDLMASIRSQEFAVAKEQVLRRLGNYISESRASTDKPSYTRGTRCCNSSPVYSFFSPSSYNLFSPTTVTHIHVESPKSKEERRDEKEKADRNFMIAVGVVSAVAAIGMSFLVGLEVKTVMETREDGRIWDEFEDGFSEKRLPKIGRFFADQKDQAYVRLATKVAFCCAAILCLLGAVCSSSGLILAGVVMGIASGMFFALNLGMHWGDREKYSQEAERLYSTLELVRA